MAKKKTEKLIEQLIRNELEVQLTRMVRKSKRRAVREAEKLNETLRLEYHKKEGFVEAEYQEVKPEEEEDSELEASQGREKIDG